jgi:hypothetical protein
LGLRQDGFLSFLFGNNNPPNLAMDTSSYLSPFNQIVTNPHFSLPTGIELFAYALYVRGIKTKRAGDFYGSGLIFLLIGFIRPYDILPPLLALPVFYLVQHYRQVWKPKALLTELFPVLALVPALVYNVWLFHYHPLFQYWSSQGDNAYMIPPYWVHLLNFGVIGWLALIRMVVVRRQKLATEPMFLLVLALGTFFCNHLGNYSSLTPWSFQVGAYLAAPLVLLGMTTDFERLIPGLLWRRVLTGLVLLIAVAGNVTILSFRCKVLGDPANRTHMFARRAEYDAWMWLRAHSQPGEVLLSSTYTASRIAKYTDLCVVAGHPFVSPDYLKVKERAERINLEKLGDHMPDLAYFNTDYVYAGPTEAANGPVRIEIPGAITTVYLKDGVAIYKINRNYH